MKKVILHVNSFLGGSTGNIMRGIASTAEEKGYKSFIAYPSSRTNNRFELKDSIRIGNILDRNIHLRKAYISGYNGCYSVSVTKRFIKQIVEIQPDIIHLHNLHNCYVNLEILFDFIKENNIPVVWTLHDCWPFTGQCPHYTTVKCDKWKTQCYNCPQYKQYPAAKVDRTEIMYKFKRNWFNGIKTMNLVTPSYWLKNEVQQSFLSDYPIKVINNGIDLSVFKPIRSNFREENNLIDKIILLGVANPWTNKKGLNIFIELSKLLDDKYKIVLVGLTSEQIRELPSNILGLVKTENQIELAKVYSAADYFVNPSLEETMGLVTVEALACGTPVIVSNSTAVPEVVNEKCGIVISENTIESYFNIIKNLNKEFSVLNCVAQAKKYDKNIKNEEYVTLYNQILKEIKESNHE
jgi:glycosyltransferase involved in cell wall biosynthesis